MRWFKKSTSETPRLLSLSPLRNRDHAGNSVANESDGIETTKFKRLTSSTEYFAPANDQSHTAAIIDGTRKSRIDLLASSASKTTPNNYSVQEQKIVETTPSNGRRMGRFISPNRLKNKHATAMGSGRKVTPTKRNEMTFREKRNPLPSTRLSCYTPSNHCKSIDDFIFLSVDDSVSTSSDSEYSGEMSACIGAYRDAEEKGTPNSRHHALTVARKSQFAVKSIKSKSTENVFDDTPVEEVTNDGRECLSSKMRNVQDKKVFTRFYPNRMVQHDDDEAENATHRRSLSYGNLPEIDEFLCYQALHTDSINSFGERKKSVVDQDDCDSGILVNELTGQSSIVSEVEESPEPPKLPVRMASDEKRHFKYVQLRADASSTNCPRNGFGILISQISPETPTKTNRFRVRHIMRGSPADREVNIRVGDELINILGYRLHNLSFNQVQELLDSPFKRATREAQIDLVICRHEASDRDVRKIVSGRKISLDSQLDDRNYTDDYTSRAIRIDGLAHLHVNKSAPMKRRTQQFQKNVTPYSSMSSNRVIRRSLSGSNQGSQVSSDQVASPEIAATSATEVNVQRSSLAKSAMNLCDDLEVDAKEKVAAAQSATLPTPSNNFCTLPRRPRSGVLSFHTVSFEKGPGKKSLGFTIVGGSDSPKGKLGIFIKSILPYGQAADCGSLMAGDEILMVNGQVCHDLSHEEAVKMFKSVKQGAIVLNICRRNKITKDQS
ncbi:PDZ domain-containing protein 2-like [Lutzomyia longipalpis]|uniref:PDZ domain-containing protein 2-like n=1 Tax=Lutzomyia longipalpis TaxID=7200 RepID=UPI002484331F|nr:PDZ domain-containing protein 2-like [Lutzomyia longipalpis]